MPAWEFSQMWREDGRIAFSQNLITDLNLTKRLINKSCISISDKILEIGAGDGRITKQLAEACKQVIAIEIDKEFFKKLATRLNKKNVELINANIMNVKLPKDDYKVFSNIPFNYTARIMNRLYFQKNPPQAAYLVVQKEAADIYVGIPRETQKSLLLKPFFTFEITYKFKKTDFTPLPSVNAVMLHIYKLKNPLIESVDKQNYFDFVVYATTRYKPTLKKSLSKIFTYLQFKRLSKNLGFFIDSKPMDLTHTQWIALYHFFKDYVSADKKIFVNGAYAKHANKYHSRKTYNKNKGKH